MYETKTLVISSDWNAFPSSLQRETNHNSGSVPIPVNVISSVDARKFGVQTMSPQSKFQLTLGKNILRANCRFHRSALLVWSTQNTLCAHIRAQTQTGDARLKSHLVMEMRFYTHPAESIFTCAYRVLIN